MDYKKIHDDLISFRKTTPPPPNTATDYHHIVAQCLGGEDNQDNLVELTVREHFLVHQLLHKIHPTEEKLLWSVYLFNNDIVRKKSIKRKHWINSKAGEILNCKHTLNKKQLRLIRRLGLTQQTSHYNLAKQFEITINLVKRIIRFQTYNNF